MKAKKVVGLVVFWSVFFWLFSGAGLAVNGDMGGGDGSEGSPWLIEDLVDFHEFAGDSNYWDDYTSLECDLNLAGPPYTTAVIAPDTGMGNWDFDGVSFTGVFDGNGHRIYNLTIDDTGVGKDYLGLFGKIDSSGAIVKNLGLENVYVIGGVNAEHLGGLCGINWFGSITNCYVTGSVNGSTDSRFIGGLCGRNYVGNIRDCYSTCSVTSGEDSYGVGGFCGMGFISISNCYSTGLVTSGIDSVDVGGFCGHSFGGISKCFWDVENSGMAVSQGGFGCTGAQMKTAATFVGWGNGNWTLSAGNYPRLAWENAGGIPLDNIPSRTYTGSGTQSDPFILANAADFLCLTAREDDWDGYYELVGDIDMTGVSIYLPPCNFGGSLDGRNHHIKNLTIHESGSSFLGLIGYVGDGAVIQNLGLENVNITGYHMLGGLCGLNNQGSLTNCYATGSVNGGDYSKYVGGFCGRNYGDISDCYANFSVTGGDQICYVGGLCGENTERINNCYSVGSVSGGDYSVELGGLCGRNYDFNRDGSINDCNSVVTVTCGNYSGELGGLCGSNNVDISNCYATGSITGGYYSYNLGGLCGSSFASISNCYATGNITNEYHSYSYRFGGLVGYNYGGISKCYSTGSVTSGNHSNYQGGLCGDNYGYISDCYATGSVTCGAYSYFLGGLCGINNYPGSISSCYSTGTVTGEIGSVDLGGLCGQNFNSDYIINCFFLDTAGPHNGYGTPLTDSEMKQQVSFFGWDFAKYWWIDEGLDYPHLQDWHEPTYLGSGTREDPYQISTDKHLNELSKWPLHWDKHFILTADIDMADYPYITAVIAPDLDTDNESSRFEGTPFTGSFDGCGHTISNLTIDTAGAPTDYLGLFGTIGDYYEDPNIEVKNLGLENVHVTGGESENYYGGGDKSQYLGGLCGDNHSSGSISNCYVTGSVTAGIGSSYLGGVCGSNSSSCDFTNCNSTVTITGGNSSGYFGGVCGQNLSTGSITNCFADGHITGGDDTHYLAGMCGYNESGSIIDCNSISSIYSGNNSANLGGICGYNKSGIISNCEASGSVTGYGTLGGLCGHNGTGSIIDCDASGSVTGFGSLGGLCGYIDPTSNIINCSASGSVTGIRYLGGICGYNNHGNITNCYATCQIFGGDDSYRVGGLCGNNNFGSINNCYSIGPVTGGIDSQRLGGLCGSSRNGNLNYSYAIGSVTGGDDSREIGGLCGYKEDGCVITSCYFLDTSGPDNGKGEPLDDPNMKIQSNFVEWDFSPNDGDPPVWVMPWMDYPRLFWQLNLAYEGQAAISLDHYDTGSIQLEIYNRSNDTLHWTLSDDETSSWITDINPNNGFLTGPADRTTVTVMVNALDLLVGDYTSELTLAADNGDNMNIPISLHVFNRVDLEDLYLLSQYWLMTGCDKTQLCSATDWYVDGNINLRDFNQLAISWLDKTITKDPIWRDFREDFSNGKPTENWEYYSSDPSGRIVVVNERLRMDCTAGRNNLNEAILHLDLYRQSNLALSFWHAEADDEKHLLPSTFIGHANGDGVAVSPDGTNWTTVVNADELDVGTTGQIYTVDLDSLDLEYTSDFQIKFQQYDNTYWGGSDGREWDDIQIEKILQ